MHNGVKISEILFLFDCGINQRFHKIFPSNVYGKGLKQILQKTSIKHHSTTGKSFSEAFILKSTNPQYDKRLFIDLPVQYMKTTSSEQFMYTTCTELVIQ